MENSSSYRFYNHLILKKISDTFQSLITKNKLSMAHNISGIITSFKYEGDLSHIALFGDYYLIPVTSSSSDKLIKPYEELTGDIRRIIKDLSSYGGCAYIETAYFGGMGAQMAEIWENGQMVGGPLISFDGIDNEIKYHQVTIVDAAINQALKSIGVSCEAGHDEFDIIGLGRYRSNRRILEEYHQKE